jgi:hypothetical protein
MNLTKSEPAADGTESGAERGEMSSKLLLIGGGVVALVGAGALAFVLLTGGDEPAPPAALPAPSASAPAPTETASPTTSASIPTYAAKNARDPFKALVVENKGGGSTTAPTSSSSTSLPPVWTPPVTTTTTTTPKPSQSTPSSTTTSPSAEPTIPYDVSIVVLSKIVDESTVEIYADDKPYTLTLGETVEGPFVLKSVDTSAQKATVQYGEVMLDLALHQIVLLQNA